MSFGPLDTYEKQTLSIGLRLQAIKKAQSEFSLVLKEETVQSMFESQTELEEWAYTNYFTVAKVDDYYHFHYDHPPVYLPVHKEEIKKDKIYHVRGIVYGHISLIPMQTDKNSRWSIAERAFHEALASRDFEYYTMKVSRIGLEVEGHHPSIKAFLSGHMFVPGGVVRINVAAISIFQLQERPS